MPVICVINTPYKCDKLVVYKASNFNNVQFMDGMPWKSCILQESYSRAKESFY